MTIKHVHERPVIATAEMPHTATESKDGKGRKTIGRTTSGAVFEVPHTTDMVSTILDPRQPKSEWDILIIGVIALHVACYLFTSGSLRKGIFLVLFMFWRASYNVGIGYVLKQQSHHNLLVKLAKQYHLFEPSSSPALYEFMRRQLTDKMGEDYNFEKSPIEYQTWLLFRRAVDLILMLDFVSYVLMAISWSHVPVSHGILLQTGRWTVGWALVMFNLWVKLDANRVVKDFAWYWGDFFYLIDTDLTFDGVYELCMHPMYSLGYAGYYGISLLACSYAVLFTSIIAHISQFVFLYVVEEPHIHKIYGQKNRVTIRSRSEHTKGLMSTERAFSPAKSLEDSSDEIDYARIKVKKTVSVFRAFDPHRAGDCVQMLTIVLGALFAICTPQDGRYRTFTVAQAFVWRLLHSCGIIYSLKSQSEHKAWTKHFLKFGTSPKKAWYEWKNIYAMSLAVTHITFLSAAWKSYSIPVDWQYGTVTLRHVLGVALIGMHVWTSISVYDVLGNFGWYFGDFFVENEVPTLKYTGVYRYLNNPERVVYSFWGVALMSNSTSVILLAAEAQILNLLFINFVEKPHMNKLYGTQIRKEAGFTKSLKSMPVVDHPQVKKTVQGIEFSLDRVLDVAISSVNDYLVQARPHIGKAVEEGKLRVNQYQNSILVAHLAGGLGNLDSEQYSVSLENRQGNTYGLGSRIRANWRSSKRHSIKDWIGIYRITDNLSKEVTRVSSRGCWSAVHNNAYYDHDDNIIEDNDNSGCVEFRGDTLPWKTGTYELRYHHAGKHNVMSISQPFEIVVDRSLENDYPILEQELLIFISRMLTSESGVNGPNSAEDEILFGDDAQKWATRIAYGIHKMCGIDFAWQLIASDASVRNITARIARSRKILAPFVTFDQYSESPGR